MIDITRRRMIGALAATGAQLATPAFGQSAAPNTAPKFSYDDVLQRARALVAAPFQDAAARLPAPFDSLDFDAWRDIRFREERAFFANLPGSFRLSTFHRGFLFPRPVTVNTIRDGIAAPIPYSPALFDFGRLKVGDTLDINAGFAGFRMNFPVNDPDVYDEAISFVGASYFRFLGRRSAIWTLCPRPVRRGGNRPGNLSLLP